MRVAELKAMRADFEKLSRKIKMKTIIYGTLAEKYGIHPQSVQRLMRRTDYEGFGATGEERT